LNQLEMITSFGQKVCIKRYAAIDHTYVLKDANDFLRKSYLNASIKKLGSS